MGGERRRCFSVGDSQTRQCGSGSAARSKEEKPLSNPPKSKSRKPPEHVEVFFDRRDGSFWMKIQGRPTQLKRSDLFREFATLGLNRQTWHDAKDGRLDEFEWLLWHSTHNRAIDYAGSVSGKRIGTFEAGGHKFLVTDEPRGVFDELPKKLPEPELFKSFVQELLPADKDGVDQWQFLCYWLSTALRTLRLGEHRPGQVCVFAGEARCGKSLLQYMITQILGGRAENPIRYIQDKTSFNADLAGAEHWCVEEPRTSTDIRTRIAFGDALKECFNNRNFSIHDKGKRAITVPLFRRGSISINDEPEILQVLPPLNGSVDDKLMLFHCAPAKNWLAQWRSVDGTKSLLKETERDGELDETRLWTAFMAELPAIRAWLLRAFKNIPAAMRDDRFLIAAYHHPDLRAQLVSFTPEARLLQLMDEIFWGELNTGDPIPTVADLKAIEIERRLRDAPKFAFVAEKLLSKAWQCGSYLGKLAKTRPDRVSKRVSDGYTFWTIQPPPSLTESKTHE